MMEVTQFTENARVLGLLKQLKERVKGRSYSDITDEQGHQYVDLVLEGGGTLGIALLGYIYVLEQSGIRFLRLAGTSAGAINVMLLAAAGEIDQRKCGKLLEHLGGKNLYDFVDGDHDAKAFVNAIINKVSRAKLVAKGMQVIDNLRGDWGLNPGTEFQGWIRNVLNQFGVRNLSELQALRAKGVSEGNLLRNRIDGSVITDPECFTPIAIIAADITTGSKIVFPEMADLFYADPGAVDPSDFVRASMSVPLFFQPFIHGDIPNTPGQWDKWNERLGLNTDIPAEVMFMDGGIISNFPIGIFDKPDQPLPHAPIFGVKIGQDKHVLNKNDEIPGILGAIFDTARFSQDDEFLRTHENYRHLIGYIDAGNHNWLDFGMSDDDKIDLFVRGAEAAVAFLKDFDWEGIKGIKGVRLKT